MSAHDPDRTGQRTHVPSHTLADIQALAAIPDATFPTTGHRERQVPLSPHHFLGRGGSSDD